MQVRALASKQQENSEQLRTDTLSCQQENTLASSMITYTQHVAVAHSVVAIFDEAMLAQQFPHADVTMLEQELELELASKLLVILCKLLSHNHLSYPPSHHS